MEESPSVVLISANTYNFDYNAERPDGGQLPALNVFQKVGDQYYHTYCTELLYSSSEPGRHPRHIDSLWPLWNVFDLAPDGRGTGWAPSVSYNSP